MTPYKPDVVLKSINFSILSDRDRLDILSHILETLAKIAGTDAHLDRIYTVLSDIRDSLYAATQKEHSHASTEIINELHENRRKAISNMHDGIKFFKGDDNRDVAAAAELAEAVYNRHFSKLADKKKRTLTAAIAEFFKAVQEPHIEAAVEKIHLVDRVDKLDKIQVRMNQLLKERAEEEELDTTPTLIPVRESMAQFVPALEKALMVNVVLNEPGMEELVHKLNGRIGEIMTTAKALHTLGEHAHLKTEPEEPGAVEESSGENSSEEKSEE